MITKNPEEYYELCIKFLEEENPQCIEEFNLLPRTVESMSEMVCFCDYTDRPMLFDERVMVICGRSVTDGTYRRVTRFKFCHPDEDEHYFYCESTGKYFDSSVYRSVSVDGATICYEYHEDSLYIWVSDNEYHWEEEPEDESHPLGLKPYACGHSSPIKSGEALSIELEVFVGCGDGFFRDRIKEAGADDAEQDGSLHPDKGAEIIFGSTAVKNIESKVDSICSVLSDYECKGHNACNSSHEYGMHVSISKRGWDISTATLAKMILLIDNNQQLFEKIAQRNSTRWASYYTKTIKGVLNKIKDREKYEAIAVRSDDRIEFRLFRSNVRNKRILKNCECVISIIRYCKSVINYKNINAKDYVCFVLDNQKVYPNLVSFLKDDIKININKL
jgi:hypothetical protein